MTEPMHRGLVWMTTIVAGILAVMVIVVAIVFSVSVVDLQSSNHRRGCADRQQLYDGEVKLTLFFAAELHATKAQTDQALKDLTATIGRRPDC